MKKNLSLLFALTAWFAVVMQFILMTEKRTTSYTEMTIRFFSFFTILTNIIVAFYFTCLLLAENKRPAFLNRPGTLTAVTVYILTVGLVYQVALRHIWQPRGMDMVVDELLHTVIPVLVVIFWFLYEQKSTVKYSQVLPWAIYPLAYLLYTLVRGSYSGFYPYPFINVSNLGMQKTLANAGIILLLFLAIAGLFIFIGKLISKK